MSAIGFIKIKKEPGIYSNRETESGIFEKFAHRTHYVEVGITYRKVIHKWYWKNQAWHQGCFFIKNPLHKTMKLDDFKVLLKKIVVNLGFDDEGKKYFKGNTYGELTSQITDFMDYTMNVLNSETHNDKWTYEEDRYCKEEYKLCKRLGLIDVLIHNLTHKNHNDII